MKEPLYYIWFLAKDLTTSNMTNILIIGAGRSSNVIIQYLLNQAKKFNWFVTVADAQPQLAIEKVNGHPNGRGTWLDVRKPGDRKDLIMRSDVVVSLLPPSLHYRLAKDCNKYNKYLVCASYVTRNMWRLNPQIIDTDLAFLSQEGLDAGVEPMASVKLVNDVRTKGGKVISLRTYAGGVMAQGTVNNPWDYRLSWNPRNIVLAGHGTTQYIIKGKYKFLPYNRLYQHYRKIEVADLGTYDSFANRDSLLFRKEFGIDDIPTLKRSILRSKGFCDAWNALVELGMTDTNFPILELEKMTYRDLFEAYLIGYQEGNKSLKDRVAVVLGEENNSDVMKKLEWLGLFDRRKIRMSNASPAQILQDLLEKKMQLQKGDKDLVINMNVIKYKLKGKVYRLYSTMTLEGDADGDTAMSKFIGLPIGIMVKMIMRGQITSKGVSTQARPEVYTPILEELKEHGLVFKNRLKEVK
jgi:saccharopine dehydrogenase (NADP+, L-glutamate forming)